MENGETTLDGAARETWEEARARVTDMELYRIFDIPYISQVYMFYRCNVVDGQFGVGPESLETAFYTEAEIPWDEIAFPVIYKALKEFFLDVRSQQYPVRVSALERKSRA